MSVKFDIVVYGATGFTGKLCVAYLAKQYKNSISWAIAGRRKDALEEIAKNEGAGYPTIIIADSGDEKSLNAMCAQAKVIATTAGPFGRYGTSVVKACVEAGCDYCDITGESAWVREMIAQHDDAARKIGSRIVHFCGHDCVPWDLMTMMLANKIKENNRESLVRVDMYDKIKSKPSGGTIETAMEIMFGKGGKGRSVASKSLGFDPFLKQRGSTGPSEFNVTAKNVTSVAREPGQEWRSMFVMAGVNANAVKRSNALNQYGNKLVYSEGLSFSSLFSAVIYFLSMVLFGIALFIPPIRWLLREYVLPKPGEGMTMEEMKKGFLTVTGVAKGSKGTIAKATISFKVDPGYLDTARMLVESALSLSLDGSKLANKDGGVYTPAACQGTVLLDRLMATGTEFSYH